MNLIKILTAESQPNKNIYELINDFYQILTQSDWLKRYIFWELELLSLIGFNLDLKNIVSKKIIDKKISYFVKSSSETKIVPNFLVEKSDIYDDGNDLINGLKLVGDFMDKTILKPNNMSHPISRSQFINSLKSLN